MATYAVVGDLELLGSLHVEASDIGHSAVDPAYVWVGGRLQPGSFGDAIVGGLQLAGLVVLHRGSLELHEVRTRETFLEIPVLRTYVSGACQHPVLLLLTLGVARALMVSISSSERTSWKMEILGFR